MQFEPEKVITQEEISQVLYKILGYEEVLETLLHKHQEYQYTFGEDAEVQPLPDVDENVLKLTTILPIGEVDLTATPEAVIEVMRLWVERIEQFIALLADEVAPLYQTLRTQLFLERGFTFEEYGHLFDQQLTPQEYHHFPAFKFLGIQTDLLRRNFISTRTHHAQDYIKTLASLHLAGWSFFLQKFAAVIPFNELLKHCYITGKSGSGKSEAMKTIMYQIQRRTHRKHSASIILLDPHGDLAKDVLAFHLNYDLSRLIYIDPYAFDGLTPRINPLQLPIDAKGNILNDEHTINLISEEISKVFQELIPDASLSNQMRTLLMPCVATLLRKGKTDFQELQTFMDDNQNEHLVELGKQSPNPSHRNFFSTRFYDSHFKRTKSSVFTKIQSLLNSHTFYNLTMGESTMNLQQAMNAGKIIIFNLSKGRMGIESSEAFGRFLIATVQTIAQRRANIEERFRKPSFLFIDEFQNYITPSIQIILKEARKYRVPLVLANQTIEDIRSTEMLSNILNNTEVKLVGRNGIKTLRELAKEIGVPVEKLQKMKKYHFMVKAGDRMAHQFKTTAFLKRPAFKLTSEEMAAVMDYQRHHYYDPIASDEPVATTERNEEATEEPASGRAEILEKQKESHNRTPKKTPSSTSSPKPKFDL